MAGGPGYVISRGALKKFGSEQESKCKRCNYSQEDCEMGKSFLWSSDNNRRLVKVVLSEILINIM